MGFKEQQAAIQRELDRFIDLLSVLLPRYSKLLKRDDLNEQELHELGEIEHFLIGVNGRWYFRPDFALVTGYEFGGITTWNVGVRFAF